MIGGNGSGIEIALAQHDGFGLAFTATGTDDQRGARGGAGAQIGNVAVDWPKCPIFYAAGVGMEGKFKRTALQHVGG